MSEPSTAIEVSKYNEDELPKYTPMPWSLREIRSAIPAELFYRSTARGMFYLLRDLALATTCWYGATFIDPLFASKRMSELLPPTVAQLARWTAWAIYWWFQGLIFTGIWVIGHECGHGAFSDIKLVNDMVGFLAHTALWTPYFSWRISHHRHHTNHASMERDETFVPNTREDLGVPDKANDEIDWEEIFGDTPLFTLFALVRQQLLAFPAYFFYNASGQKTYPKWTNHFDPNSILFTREQRNAVIISNMGLGIMVWATVYFCSIYGTAKVIKYYLFPWVVVSHWFVMITYLHHTDPMIPHYRGKAWNFQRGAASTVDRPFLGWQGRFFLHDIAHYHVIHHFFPKIPFYHGYEATLHLKAFIGDSYVFSGAPVFQALWKNYNACQFVENKGDVLFYRNRRGEAHRRPSPL